MLIPFLMLFKDRMLEFVCTRIGSLLAHFAKIWFWCFVLLRPIPFHLIFCSFASLFLEMLVTHLFFVIYSVFGLRVYVSFLITAYKSGFLLCDQIGNVKLTSAQFGCTIWREHHICDAKHSQLWIIVLNNDKSSHFPMDKYNWRNGMTSRRGPEKFHIIFQKSNGKILQSIARMPKNEHSANTQTMLCPKLHANEIKQYLDRTKIRVEQQQLRRLCARLRVVFLALCCVFSVSCGFSYSC